MNIFLVSPWKRMLWKLIKVSHCGASNKYLQYMFLWRNKNNINIIWLKKKQKNIIELWLLLQSCTFWSIWSIAYLTEDWIQYMSHTLPCSIFPSMLWHIFIQILKKMKLYHFIAINSSECCFRFCVLLPTQHYLRHIEICKYDNAMRRRTVIRFK